MRKNLFQAMQKIEEAKKEYFEVAIKFPLSAAYVGEQLLGEDYVLFRPPEEYKSMEGRQEDNARNLVLSVFKKGKISTELGLSQAIIDKCVEANDKQLLWEIANNISNAYKTLTNYVKQAAERYEYCYRLLLRKEEI